MVQLQRSKPNEKFAGDESPLDSRSTFDYGSMAGNIEEPNDEEEEPSAEDIEVGPATVYIYKASDEERRDREFAEAETCQRWSTRVALGSILGLSCLFAVFTILPVAMMVIGIRFLDACPAMPAVPVLLIVTGSLMAASNIVNIMDQICACCFIPSASRGKHILMVFVNVTLNGLVLASLLLLSAWIYGTRRPLDMDSLSEQFCDPMLYVFTYCLVNFLWIFGATITFILFIFCSCISFV